MKMVRQIISAPVVRDGQFVTVYLEQTRPAGYPEVVKEEIWVSLREAWARCYPDLKGEEREIGFEMRDDDD